MKTILTTAFIGISFGGLYRTNPNGKGCGHQKNHKIMHDVNP